MKTNYFLFGFIFFLLLSCQKENTEDLIGLQDLKKEYVVVENELIIQEDQFLKSGSSYKLFLIFFGNLCAVDHTTGELFGLGPAVWQNSKAMTSLNGWLYIVQNKRLYKVNPSTGSYSQLGGAWWTTNFKAMTSLGSYLYIVENNRLFRVDPNTGGYSQLGGAWWTTNFKAITGLGSYLYIVENNRLFRVDPNTGGYSQLGGAVWTTNFKAMTSLGSYLYIVENSRLYRVNPNNGNYMQLGGLVWYHTEEMTRLDGSLYIYENSRLNKVNPSNGSYVEVAEYFIPTSSGNIPITIDAMTSLN